MKTTLLLSTLMAVLLAACSSTPTKTEAPVKVEEVKPMQPAPSPAPAPVVEAPRTVPQAEVVAPAKPLVEEKQDDSPFPPKSAAGALGQRSIFYTFDAFSVADEYRPVAEAHAGFLSKHGKSKLTLQGNCDERGSREYNLALGSRRAESVKTLMTASGASDTQIEVVSFGKEKPQATGHDEDAWAKNRRVDIVYQGE